jgi:PKD repeat protein
MRFAWDPALSPVVVGYKLYYGQSSENYTASVDVGNVTFYTLSGLQDGKIYYITATSYTASGEESDFADEFITTTDAAAPVASFTAAPTTGIAPLPVAFTDASTGAMTGRQWTFGDGTSSSAQHPAHTYSTPGTYAVSLTVSGPGGAHTHTRPNLVTVLATPPVASFIAAPTTGTAPLPVVFTDTSTGTMTGWQWSFGDGTSSTARHPSHVYTSAGHYTVSLTVSGPGGSHTTTQASRVTATPETVMIWMEGEAGKMTSQMKVDSDSTASAQQYVWVPDGNGTLTDPSQEGGLVQYTFTVPAADAYVVWGRVRLGATGTGSFYLALQEQSNTQEETPSITGVVPQRSVVTPLTVGSVYYTDRTYTITRLAPELQGPLAIKTGNNDKYNTAGNYLSFTLSHAATLYVAYDSTATRSPSWLSTAFTRTALEMRTTDKPLTVWKREVAAGPVTLPGNLAGGALGATSNYLVFVDFGEQSPTPGTAPLAWVWDQAAADTMPVFFLSEGTYTLSIKQRESGTKLDRILVTNDVEYKP